MKKEVYQWQEVETESILLIFQAYTIYTIWSERTPRYKYQRFTTLGKIKM